MIQATRLNGSSIYINPELVETIEKTPDTIITLTSGKKYVVKEDLRARRVLRAPIKWLSQRRNRKQMECPNKNDGRAPPFH